MSEKKKPPCASGLPTPVEPPLLRVSPSGYIDVDRDDNATKLFRYLLSSLANKGQLCSADNVRQFRSYLLEVPVPQESGDPKSLALGFAGYKLFGYESIYIQEHLTKCQSGTYWYPPSDEMLTSRANQGMCQAAREWIDLLDTLPS
ncbi:hypothetical protein [Propionivibrio dicarboxylicus]|nr:hypothetical protein [Propionivibrio dicarboxylicus]